MCLSRVLKEKLVNPRKIHTAYKVFEVATCMGVVEPEQISSLVFPVVTIGTAQTGVWLEAGWRGLPLRAHAQKIMAGSGEYRSRMKNIFYPPGFHMFPTQEAACKWAYRFFTKRYTTRVVVRVEASGIHTIGLYKMYDDTIVRAWVTDRMRIPSDWNARKSSTLKLQGRKFR
jgi:hypothetical protein